MSNITGRIFSYDSLMSETPTSLGRTVLYMIEAVVRSEFKRFPGNIRITVEYIPEVQTRTSSLEFIDGEEDF
jgi:hypothetical protein